MDITINITEEETININLLEQLEDINIDISEGTTVYSPCKSTYEIEFNISTDIWAFYSEYNGYITDAELENVSSYTIDGVSESLPFEVENNQTYLIEIVKTNPALDASILFNIDYIKFNEVNPSVDYTIGDGKYTYLLGNITANTTLLKYDNRQFTRANYSGAGAWLVNPLSATITLPTLPANGVWSRILYTKDDYMLVSGGNTASKDKYFCKVDITTNVVTNLSDVVNDYSMFTGGDRNSYMTTQLYDYVNNIVYWGTYGGVTTVKLEDVVILDLNDFTFSDVNPFTNSAQFGEMRKVNFDPYQENFLIGDLIQNVNKNPFYSYQYAYSIPILLNNPYNNKFYHTIINDIRRMGEFDHKGNFLGYEIVTSGIKGGAYLYTFDKENNHNISYTRQNVVSWKNHFRKWGVQSYGQYPVFNTVTEIYPLDAMFGKDYLHLCIFDDFKRLHLYDMNVDLSTTDAEFGYLDLPNECWSLYTTRLL